jgi:hypothetical protein
VVATGPSDSAPYLPSAALRLETIGRPVRRADLDGDDWPVTWADDDRLYAAYGDGWGCRPVDPATKRNTGLVRLAGAPPDFTGEEVAMPWFGAGAEAPNLKGCGLLALDGTLYHFLRYQVGYPAEPRDQLASALIWSPDLGATWEGATYAPDPDGIAFFFEEDDRAFSAPTFLQAGRDYRAAPDDYVYLYAPHEDRRRRNDHLDLARVPRARVLERGAYEFFAGLEGGDRPRWSRRVAGRAPVFTFPGHVGCGDVVYLPGRGRYFLATCAAWPAADRRPSRLGFFDAPHPWGPWSTAGFVADWGSGQDGDCRYDPRLPARWLAEDGATGAVTATLVFSDRTRSDVLNYQEIRFAPAGAGGVVGGAGRPARGR